MSPLDLKQRGKTRDFYQTLFRPSSHCRSGFLFFHNPREDRTGWLPLMPRFRGDLGKMVMVMVMVMVLKSIVAQQARAT
jgi:hypothetical protein